MGDLFFLFVCFCLVLFALFLASCRKKQEKKWPESFDKHERDLEDQKGSLTESVTNYKLSLYCRLSEQLARQHFRLPGVHSKNTLQNI